MTLASRMVIREGQVGTPADAEAFEWDDDEDDCGNTAHLATHHITPWEAESVFANGCVFVPNKQVGSGDWLMIGTTGGGRPLTLVLEYKQDRRLIRVFTGWETTAGERARFQQRRGRRK